MAKQSKQSHVDVKFLKEQIATYRRLMRRVTPGPWFEYRGLIWSEPREGQPVASVRHEDLYFGTKAGVSKECAANSDYITALNPKDFQEFLAQVDAIMKKFDQKKKPGTSP
ncbi:MAG: hypothetical protein NPIRA02_40800 [Nitrospirales bacterium]|nr:MAG: hypothetical protein NPIRA02_40800 [Nitrospirales bacterium]